MQSTPHIVTCGAASTALEALRHARMPRGTLTMLPSPSIPEGNTDKVCFLSEHLMNEQDRSEQLRMQ
jgi:hypothetical protein